jgi:hypothetical protein
LRNIVLAAAALELVFQLLRDPRVLLLLLLLPGPCAGAVTDAALHPGGPFLRPPTDVAAQKEREVRS